MRTALVMMVLLSIVSTGSISYADRPEYNRPSAVLGLGVGSNLCGDMSFSFTARVQYPKYTPLALEMFLLMPYGIGADLQIAGYANGRLTVRLLDLGFFVGREPANAWVNHNWSIVAGSGLEYRFPSPIDKQSIEFFSCTLTYRVFLPDPGSVLANYGDFGKDIYLNALQRGQVIIGVTAAF